MSGLRKQTRRRRWRSRLGLLTVSLGCFACTVDLGPHQNSSDAGAGGQGAGPACVPPSGSYQATYRETSGNCGPQLSETLVLSGGQPYAECVGDYQQSATGCHGSFSLSCALQPAQTAERSGTLDWSSDGKEAHGSMTVSVETVSRDAAGETQEIHSVCSSSYDFKYIRL